MKPAPVPSSRSARTRGADGFNGGQARDVTYVFGNALTAFEMTKHDARSELYVPLRLLAQEIAEGRVLITYDRPSSLLTIFRSREIDEVARGLDAKVERLLCEASARAG
jgi:hypothetical protein